MARSTILIFSIMVFLFFVSNCVANGVPGGITKIKKVKTNIEVQELGCYSVGEYNKLQKDGGGVLKFSKVVDAESQVVSGIKYYLKIEAVTQCGCSEVYDAEVVVKPWLNSKQLLSFKPSK